MVFADATNQPGYDGCIPPLKSCFCNPNSMKKVKFLFGAFRHAFLGRQGRQMTPKTKQILKCNFDGPMAKDDFLSYLVINGSFTYIFV